MLTKYAMVIDLHRCTGCGACAISCKIENNVPEGFRWADYTHETRGVFPDLSYEYIPTLCNHCDNPPCVEVCPTDPKSMYKTEDGLTLQDAQVCIGCRQCENACPYGVIFFNSEKAHQFWRDSKGRELLEAVKARSEEPEVAPVPSNNANDADENDNENGGEGDEVELIPPYYNPNRARTYAGVRPQEVVEKCTFCDHRIIEGLQPYCVEACPSGARYFGDLEDENSMVFQLLSRHRASRLKEHEKTEPKVYYVRQYKPET